MNQPPVATDDIANTPVNMPIGINVLTNDNDPDGDALTVTINDTPTNGTVSVDPTTGIITYTPITGYVGQDSFTYVICDDGTPSLCDTATVYIEVIDNTNPDNNAPIANTDITGTLVNVPVTGNLLNNDFDVDGDNITANTTPVMSPTNGTVTIAPDGTFTYTPNTGFVGIDTVIYSICDDGTPVLCDTAMVIITVSPDTNGPDNNEPIAVDDANVTLVNNPVSGNVLPNDSDPNGDNLTPTLATNPVNGGAVVLNPDGSYTYTPAPGYTGPDYFTYSVCDDGTPVLCDTATVYITVLLYPDCGVLPDTTYVLDADCNGGITEVCLPIEFNDIGNYLITVDGTPLTTPITGCGLDTLAFYVTPNGNGPYVLQWTVNGTQFNGTAPNVSSIVDSMNVWDPTGNWGLMNDTISANAYSNIFNYGTLTATNAANIPSFRQLNINFDAYGSAFEVDITAQQIVLVDTVNGCIDTTILSITCDSNLPPVAINDINITYVNIPIAGNVLPNDFDPNGDSLIVSTTPVFTPSNGLVTINPTGGYVYTPFQGFVGQDVFSYVVCDIYGLCDTAIVVIDVLSIPSDTSNNAPVAITDNGVTQPGVTLTGDLLNNDFDPDGDNITINTTPVTTPTNGTVTIDPTGTYTYVPNPGLNGITTPVADSFSYVICDDGIPSLCDTAMVYINVIPDFNGSDNDPPVAIDDANNTDINTPVTGSVLPNDFDVNGDNIFVTTLTVTTDQGVTVTIDPITGNYIYTPPTGFVGTDQFTYTICDDGTPSLCADATVYITVDPFTGNEPPVAVNDINDTYRNIPVSGNILPNDYDLNGDSLIVNTTPITNPVNGTVTVNTDGSYTYVPGFNFIGQDSFDYVICDPAGLCDTATVYISVIDWNENDNDAPTANNDAAVTYTDVPVTGTVLNNDFDIDGDNITVSTPTVTTTNGVTVTINPTTGFYTYTPPTGFVGTDTFSYVICDDGIPSLCDTALVIIDVLPDNNGTVNNPPFAGDDAVSTIVNVPVGGNILPNDYDTDSDSLVVNTTPIVDPTNGAVVINDDGTFTYTPDPDFTGTDQFVYEICDTVGACAEATVYVVVNPDTLDNNPPVAVYDFNNTIAGVAVSGDVLTNDFDVDGDSLLVNPVVTQDVPATDGSLTWNGDGTYMFTPAPGFSGTTTFVYEICDQAIPSLCDTAVVYITVIEPTVDNDAPVANPDVTITLVDVPVSGDLLTNDFDPDGDDLVIDTIPLTPPTNGVVTINPDGTYTYAPDPGFIGTDIFTYVVCDDQVPALCDTAIVVIDVVPDHNGTDNNPPFAGDDADFTNVDVPLTADLFNNDNDPNGDNFTVTTFTQPDTGGVVTVDPITGQYTFTPDPGFVGPTSFTYTICDDGVPSECDSATVYITVLPDLENNPPVAIIDINTIVQGDTAVGNVLTNDFDVDGDNITLDTVPVTNPINGIVIITADGSYTYIPTPTFIGLDSFTYVICDDGIPGPLCDTATVYINVIPEPTDSNDAPIANNDAGVTLVNTPLTGDVSNNDFDPDNDPLTFILLDPTDNGVVTLLPNGTYIYTPDTNYVGTDQFTYVVCDPAGLCDTATVFIDVLPDSNGTDDNDAPIAVDDAVITDVNTPVGGNVLPNDFDPNGDSLIVNTTPIVDPTNGTVTIDPLGNFVYTPDSNFVGTDQFVYEVCDTAGLCVTATVYVTVVPDPTPNTAPIAVNDINNTIIDVAVSGNVLTNDSDPDGDSIVVTTVPTPLTLPSVPGATVTIDSTGNYTYTPATGFTGLDSFTYVMCDVANPSLCDTAIVYITVIAEPTDSNDAPIANNDAYVTPMDTPIPGDVSNNDFDPDGDPLTFTILTPVTNGSMVFDPITGQFIYTPNPGFIGNDTTWYIACDAAGLCDTAMVVIEVTPDYNGNDNNPPYAADDAFITDINTQVVGNILPNDSDPNGDSLVVNTIPVTQPTNGTVTIDPDGTMTYTPNTGYTGPDQFTYSVCDTFGLCDTATVYITVVPLPDTIVPPIAVNDINVTLPGTPVSGNVLTNDYDQDGGTITATPILLTPPTIGTIAGLGQLNTDGSYTYIPNAGVGVMTPALDSFTYVMCDNDGLCDTAVVYITIMPQPINANDAPIANHDAYVTPVNFPIDGDVSNNDFDSDFEPLTFTLLTNLNNGGLNTTFNPNTGEFTYTPNTDYVGLDTFFYQACDAAGLCDTAMVIIDIIPDLDTTGNDKPFAADDAFITNVDVPITGEIFPNDSDPNGDSFTVDTASTPLNGSVVIDLVTGQFIYTPNPNYSGPDQFTYVICDTGVPSLCDTATVYILVVPDPSVEPDTVYVSLPVMTTDTFCVPVGLIDLVGPVDSIEYVNCSFSLDYGTVISTINDTCFIYDAGPTPSLMDNDTVCIVLYDSLGNTDTTVFIINVTPNCSDFDTILPPALTVIAGSCAGDGELCIPIAPNTIGDYDVFLNDSLYNLTSTSVGCNNDSTYFVNVGMIPSSVDSFDLTWTILGGPNAGVYGPTTFFNANDVLAWMQGIDPDGNWGQNGMMITGFAPDASYGSMIADYDILGQSINMAIQNFSTTATGTQVTLPVGTHQLVVVDSNTGCADTAIVTVLCAPTDTVYVIVPTNSVNEFCPDISDLPGNIVSMTNICPDESDNGDVITNTTCFDYDAFGVAGYDTACIVICDDLGVCDTTIYIITVVPTPDTIVVDMVLGTDSTLCIPVSELPTTLDSIYVGTNCEELDSADLIITQVDTCILIIPGALGSDTTCIVICDSLGFCDTTYIIVNIGDGLEPPIAVNDTVPTIVQEGDAPPFGPNPINIDVLPNDTIPGSLISISIITPPILGTAVVLPDGTIDYTQLEKCPYIDSFSYEICNSAGCDTAWVFIDVTCNDITIYNGFSPNGDGVNDFFTIEGIEDYPSAKLIIFNRWGNRVYLHDGNGTPYANDWGGTWDENKMLPDGTYFYILELNDDKSRKFSGYIQIHR